ncbi:smoothelin-like protein 1 [Vombatus ursinus]|uniref:smoothelin-like protein 1 n=1 Tax=Vombatus ursinus TaxID=29139 RepID=UPI000FFD5807|nr:smoothelin-like protein 1 [Vombatus ursinus]
MEQENGKPLQEGTTPSIPTETADTSGTVGNGCANEEELAKDMAQKMSDKQSEEVGGADNENRVEEAQSEAKTENDEEAKSDPKKEVDEKEETKEEADGKEEAKSEPKKGDNREEIKCDSAEEATKESEKENKETSCSELEAETISDTQVIQEVGGTDGEPSNGTEKEQGESSAATPSSPEEWPESPTGEGQHLSPDTTGPESPTASDSSPSDVPQSPTGLAPSEEKTEKPSEYRVSAPTRPRGPRAQNRKAIMDKFGGAATGPAPLFRNAKAAGAAVGSVRNMLLEWCRAMTRKYEHVDIQNFSSSWSSGMAFCALIHKFFPDAFDYTTLDPKKRRENFTLAFSTAENLADCAQLLDVDDMVRLSVPDSKCVYTYIQELYRSLVQKGLVKTKKK